MRTEKLPPEVREQARRAAHREYSRAVRAGELDAVAARVARRFYRATITAALLRKRCEERARLECSACGGPVSAAERVGLPLCGECVFGAVS